MSGCVDAELIRHAEAVAGVLKAQGLSVVTAESCTGGLIAAILSQTEAAGEVLQGGFVTYAKKAKSLALGVDPEILKSSGSVNGEVVAEMAKGALARSPADISVAISGVLGPSEDEDGNPVGLVYVCAQKRGSRPVIVRRDFGRADADTLRRRAVLLTFDVLAEAFVQA